MSLADELAKLCRSFRVNSVPKGPRWKLVKEGERATTITLDRPLSDEEHAIAEWLLRNAEPPALDFLPQLKVARVTGRCSCGCPTVDLTIPQDLPREKYRRSPIAEGTGYVGPDMVGLMLFQAGGHLTCLEVYDLSDISHPYPLPALATLSVLSWPDRDQDG